MKLPSLTLKKKLITGGVVIALAAGGVTAALNSPQTTGADTSPVTTQLQQHSDELANHEARITNTENDVKDLQDKTSTPPSSTRVEVPVYIPAPAVTQSSPSVTAPAPVTVTGSGLMIGGQYDGYCILTYSDGSKDYVKATLTTTTSGNSSSSVDNCNTFIGQNK